MFYEIISCSTPLSEKLLQLGDLLHQRRVGFHLIFQQRFQPGYPGPGIDPGAAYWTARRLALSVW